MSSSKVVLVTGASRGAGAGIARGFGELGYTVYVTGRTVAPGDAKGWDGTVLPGTVAQTAADVTERGGKGIAVMCDHSDDAQVAALFEQIEREQGRLDILVNNATYIRCCKDPRCWPAVSLCRQLACGADDGEAGARIDWLWLFLWRQLLYARTGLWCTKGRHRQIRA
jgi:NAD(P)-dependent dehydrogenase (short-subunit alcohol dehydrogenase family)